MGWGAGITPDCANKLGLVHPLLAHMGLLAVCSKALKVPPKQAFTGALREGAEVVLSCSEARTPPPTRTFGLVGWVGGGGSVVVPEMPPGHEPSGLSHRRI